MTRLTGPSAPVPRWGGGPFLVAGLAALVVSGCVAPLAHATPDDAVRAESRWPGTTVDSLEAGRRLMTFRCTGCHGMKLPQKFPAEKWPKLLVDMQKEAKLTPAEKDLIERFILTIATRPPPSLDGGLAGTASAAGAPSRL